jgi:HAD superfamily hydrolase (TIGR01509 family)
MKVLLLDADGVVLRKGEYFSEKYAREYHVPKEDVLEFFKGPYIECQKGTADLKEEILPYLAKWGWIDGADSFLEYWFKSDVLPNFEIKDVLLELKSSDVKIYLASNNEKYRAQEITKVISELGWLDGFYFSSAIKFRKEDDGFFHHVLKDLVVSPSEAVFIDNDQKNVDSALRVGIESYLYNDQTMNKLALKFK